MNRRNRVVVVGLFALCAGLLVACKELPPTTFGAAQSWSMGTQPRALDLADVSGDGIVDVLSGSNQGLVVRAGTSVDGYDATTTYPFSAYGFVRSIDHGDLDGDGLAEVVAATSSRVERWERTGTGLTAGSPLLLDANVVRIDDVTGDGLEDLVVLGWASDVLTVYAQQAGGTLAAAVPYTVDVGGYNDLDIGDVDGDGDNDVVVMSGQTYATPHLTVLLQGPTGTLATRGTFSIAGTNIRANGVAVGNADQDATAEIVVSHGGNGASAKATVFEADTTGALAETTTFAVADIPTPVELADLNGDGHDDAVIGHNGWNKVSVIYGGHSSITGEVHTYSIGSGQMLAGAMVATDVDGDTDIDIGVVTNNGGFSLLRNTGVPEPTTTTTSTTSASTTTVPPSSTSTSTTTSSTTSTSTTSTSTTTSSTTTSTSTTSTTLPPGPTGDVVEIATNTSYACARHTDATVSCWGGNSSGRLGDGTTTNRSTPVTVVGLTGVTDIALGYQHACAVRSDSSVACWGDNGVGQLGDGTTTGRSTPVTVQGLTGVVQVAAGNYHTCAVRTNGSVACWGYNQLGQLGDGTTTNRSTPVDVTGLSGAVEIAAG